MKNGSPILLIGAQNQLPIPFCSDLVFNKTLKDRNSTPLHSGVRRIYFSRGRISFGRAELNSAPGAKQTRGGAENLIIPRERGRDIL